jgi:hypothetical protein
MVAVNGYLYSEEDALTLGYRVASLRESQETQLAVIETQGDYYKYYLIQPH